MDENSWLGLEETMLSPNRDMAFAYFYLLARKKVPKKIVGSCNLTYHLNLSWFSCWVSSFCHCFSFWLSSFCRCSSSWLSLFATALLLGFLIFATALLFGFLIFAAALFWLSYFCRCSSFWRSSSLPAPSCSRCWIFQMRLLYVLPNDHVRIFL